MCFNVHAASHAPRPQYPDSSNEYHVCGKHLASAMRLVGLEEAVADPVGRLGFATLVAVWRSRKSYLQPSTH